MQRTLIARLTGTAIAAGLAVALTACGGSSHSSALPTVTMMVGGIDKQIYLPYQLAQGLGYYQKYGVDMQLSTEQQGGVGAEEAMASGQADMAGAWYEHTIEFQQSGKDVISVAQLSGAPGEREMCATNANVHTPADWKGKSVGVTDPGSGTDDLTRYLAARQQLTTQDFSRVGVGEGSTLISALQRGRISCAMTTQPTVAAIEKKNLGYSAIDLASTDGAQKWLGGVYPAAGVLAQASWVNSHKDLVQKVVDALVATMHYIHTHSAADIAAHMPPKFVSNSLITKDDYIKALDQDKGQFLPDGMMPAGAPQTALTIDQQAGKIKQQIDLAKTYTDQYVIEANKTIGSGG
ncbi:ABC transporter substrate-binding protein [Nocardia sp. CA2R105]|uniref:ABC transporter substrate-binding protein n=1 Tax=Nocardia coffeae TaxID=2873381 RepID=UPI001CA611A0|nr:ABC transporter substrate-binding protein [Nocardia coffeae]MBY8861281.1 ABC transporter substrate-binding protein [Nocardia coffeae]